MVTDMDTVNETAGSVQVCAEITGVSGMLECAVTNTATLNGNAKASKLITFHVTVVPNKILLKLTRLIIPTYKHKENKQTKTNKQKEIFSNAMQCKNVYFTQVLVSNLDSLSEKRIWVDGVLVDSRTT